MEDLNIKKKMSEYCMGVIDNGDVVHTVCRHESYQIYCGFSVTTAPCTRHGELAVRSMTLVIDNKHNQYVANKFVSSDSAPPILLK